MLTRTCSHLIDPTDFAQGWYASAILSPLFYFILLVLCMHDVCCHASGMFSTKHTPRKWTERGRVITNSAATLARLIEGKREDEGLKQQGKKV